MKRQIQISLSRSEKHTYTKLRIQIRYGVSIASLTLKARHGTVWLCVWHCAAWWRIRNINQSHVHFMHIAHSLLKPFTPSVQASNTSDMNRTCSFIFFSCIIIFICDSALNWMLPLLIQPHIISFDTFFYRALHCRLIYSSALNLLSSHFFIWHQTVAQFHFALFGHERIK